MKATDIRLAKNEFERRQLEKIGYFPIENVHDSSLFERAMNSKTKLKNFVIVGEVTFEMILIVGILSGDIPKKSWLRKLLGSMDRYRKEGEKYFLSKDSFVKMLYYLYTSVPEGISDGKSFFEALDILSGLIEGRDNPEVQTFVNEEYGEFQKEVAKKERQEKMAKIGLKVKFDVGFFAARDFRDVISAHSFASVIVTLLNERMLISVKDEATSKKLFGENGIKAVIPIVNNMLGIGLEGDKTVSTLAHQRRDTKSTLADCERAVTLLAATL